MQSEGPFNKTEVKKSLFSFLRPKRSGKLQSSPEVNEFERLSSLPSPHTSPVPLHQNTPNKVKKHYLSESTVNMISKIEARMPDLTLHTDTANNTNAPPKEDADFLLSAVFDSSPRGFENQQAEALRRSGSLHKSRSMGAITGKSPAFALSPPRNEPGKPEYIPTEATKSPDPAFESLSNDELDHEELLQAEYNKLFQIGREIGYDDDEVRQWVDYVLEHGLPDSNTGSDMDSEVIESEVDRNNARVPEFIQRDPAVKETERRYIQDVFGENTMSTRQLLVDTQYTSDEIAAPSGQHGSHTHGNANIASHVIRKAYCDDPVSSSSSSAASPIFQLVSPKIEHGNVTRDYGSHDRLAMPDAGTLWFRSDMDRGHFRESPETGFKVEDTGDQKHELKRRTNTVDSNGLIPLLLPLRCKDPSSSLHKRTRNAPTAARVANPYILKKVQNVGQSKSCNRGRGLRTSFNQDYQGGDNSAQVTSKPTPLNEKRKEQLTEATATLANLTDYRTSIDRCSISTYDSWIDSFDDKQSTTAHLSGTASERSTSIPDSPTLGYSPLSTPSTTRQDTNFSTPSTTLQDINTPSSSQLHPRYVPFWFPSANSKMKMAHKNVDSGKSKVSSRDVSCPSPCGTISEGSSNRESTPSTKWDAEMWFANEKLQGLRRETGTEINWRNNTDPAFKWRSHPNHNREWNAANLRCTNCFGFCSVCRAPCCVHVGVMHTMREFNRLPEEKRETAKLLKKMDQWCPQGIDVPTFLQCTECNRRVCPDCCGVCPIFPCHDRICKECKTNPWAPCDGVHEAQTREYLRTLRGRGRVQYFQH